MEFKITRKTTLYQVQEECKNNTCEECGFYREDESGCPFCDTCPCEWHIPKPKTYKEDLLKKYPNVFISNEGIPDICRDLLYFGETAQCLRDHKLCKECWNEIMEDE